MIKHINFLIIIFFVFIVGYYQSSFAVNYVEFDRDFGGKGSGSGKFGKTINVAFDSNNNIYISDKDNKMIQKLDSAGNFAMQISESSSEVSLFNAPGDIAVDNQGNIYVADWGSDYIEGTDNPRLYFYSPCVHKLSPFGTLINTYFIDKFAPKPRTVTPGTFVVDENGKYGWAIQPKYYNRELLVTVDSKDNIYVLDVKNNVIIKYRSSGEEITSFGRYGSGAGEFDNASDMVIDKQDNILIADKGNNRVVKFDSAGNSLLTFGSKGQSDGQFIEPVFIMVTQNNDIIVKDSSKFERIGLEHPFRGKESSYSDEYVITPSTSDDAYIRELNARIRRIEEAIKDGENEETSVRDKLLAKYARYYTVIERVQIFSDMGEYKNRAIYKIDKNNKELHDLVFFALDPAGRLYLRDQDRLIVKRYNIKGFMPKFSEIEATYTARTENRDDKFLEDYGDIDEKTDLEDTRMNRALKQALLVNYDFSEKWNLSLHNKHSIARQESTNETPPKPEDNYKYNNQGWDNDVGMNLKFIANPDPYRYREMNFYSQFLAGQSRYQSDAIFTNVNKQSSNRDGSSRGFVVGADMDIHYNANVSVEYLRLRPDLTSRNITTYLYDVSGDLYQISKSFNSASIIVGELNIKF
ncbi:TPA: hypothetical protein ENS27_11320 [bacterium]|nr:hypothetical protein [bacterium]